MENNLEGLEPQNPPEGSTPTVEEVVTLSKKELDDLTHRAEVSSQNFERAKKAEDRVKDLENLNIEVPSGSEEEFVRKSEFDEVKQKLNRQEVIELHPQLKELWSDFEMFRSDPENKGMNMRTAAKSFLVEKGLLEPQRKGLEKPTGGPRIPISTGMTTEEIKNLRETNFKKYEEMLMKGQIKFSS